LEQSELRRVIAELIERLPEVERTIITLYYGKEFTLRQISTVVNLHETRVSQLKSQAILRLRSAMHMKWPH
jgi:RNA polymerase sigma factor for flagellar operon FliA